MRTGWIFHITIIRVHGTEPNSLICKKAPHALWVLRFGEANFSKAFNWVYPTVSAEMGGDRKRIEPENYDTHMKNAKAWNKVKSRGLIPFLEKLYGSNQEATNLFVKNWNNGNLTLFGRNVELNENVIADVTGLSTKGNKFFRDRNFSDEAVIRFPKRDKERLSLVKIANSNFDADTKRPFGEGFCGSSWSTLRWMGASPKSMATTFLFSTTSATRLGSLSPIIFSVP